MRPECSPRCWRRRSTPIAAGATTRPSRSSARSRNGRGEIFGFPDGATGIFVTGTSIANFIALIVARTAALGLQSRREGIATSGKRLTGYVSAAAHGCVRSAMELAGFGSDALRLVAIDAGHRIRLDALAETIAADRRAGCTPFFLVGNAGTVDIGAIDDLEALASLAEAEGLWFHIDGALGALAVLAPELKPRFKGLERADSLAFDFHKFGQVPYDAGFILVRDGERHRAAFAAPAAYLSRESRGLAGGSPWPCDFGPDLSRGFRALKTWFTLRVHGTDKIGAEIARSCALAQHLKGRIEADARLELPRPGRAQYRVFPLPRARARPAQCRYRRRLARAGHRRPVDHEDRRQARHPRLPRQSSDAKMRYRHAG